MPVDTTTDRTSDNEQSANFNTAWRAAHADGLEPNVRRWLDHIDLPQGSVYELDALGARSEHRDESRRAPNLIAFTRDRNEVLRLVAEADGKFRAQGVYIVPAVMDPGWIQYDFSRWQWCTKAWGRCSDQSILVRRNLPVDFDCDSKPKKESSTQDELRASVQVGFEAYRQLLELGERLWSKASWMRAAGSGNGFHIDVALDIPESAQALLAVSEFLKVLGAIHDEVKNGHRIKVDPSCSNASRMFPMYGTMKRKGTPDRESGRIWRRTVFLEGAPISKRLGLDDLLALTLELRKRLPDEAPAPSIAPSVTVEADPGQASSEPSPTASTGVLAEWRTFYRDLELLPMEEVLRFEGLLEGTYIRCPGHGDVERDSSVAVLAFSGRPSWLNCKHARCVGKGNGRKSGEANWSNIGIVMAHRGVNRREAGRILAERFSIPVPRGRRTAAPGAAEPGRIGRPELPEIRILTEEAMTNDDACDALRTRGNGFYERGQQIVRVFESPDNATISIVSQPTLREELTRVARWLRYSEDGWTPAHPPGWSVAAVHARGQWGLPEIRGVVEAPCLRSDGTVLFTPGYDAVSKVYLKQGPAVDVPTEPTHEDAARALLTLRDILSDFPFKEPVDESCALAAMLTPAVRATLPGCAPFFLVRATTPGAGKDLLAQVVANIWLGRDIATQGPCADADETRKNLFAVALGGQPIALYSDLGWWGNPVWATALTTETLTDRVLGLSQTAMALIVTMFMGTGNNTTVYGDCVRRVVVTMLEPEEERPEQRTQFKYADLKAHVRDHRSVYISAALTILRAYHAAGCPVGVTWGSFQQWARLVAGALVWLGMPNPVESYKRLSEEEGTDLQAIGAVLSAWKEMFGDEAVPVGRVLTAANGADELDSNEAALAGAIMNWAQDTNGKLPSPQKLGRQLSRIKGRVVGQLKLVPEWDSKRKQNWWRVVKVESRAPSAGRAGTTAGIPKTFYPPQNVSALEAMASSAGRTGSKEIDEATLDDDRGPAGMDAVRQVDEGPQDEPVRAITTRTTRSTRQIHNCAKITGAHERVEEQPIACHCPPPVTIDGACPEGDSTVEGPSTSLRWGGQEGDKPERRNGAELAERNAAEKEVPAGYDIPAGLRAPGQFDGAFEIRIARARRKIIARGTWTFLLPYGGYRHVNGPVFSVDATPDGAEQLKQALRSRIPEQDLPELDGGDAWKLTPGLDEAMALI